MIELGAVDSLNGLRSEETASVSNSSLLVNEVDFLQLFKRNITTDITALFKYQEIFSKVHGKIFWHEWKETSCLIKPYSIYTITCQIPYI